MLISMCSLHCTVRPNSMFCMLQMWKNQSQPGCRFLNNHENSKIYGKGRGGVMGICHFWEWVSLTHLIDQTTVLNGKLSKSSLKFVLLWGETEHPYPYRIELAHTCTGFLFEHCLTSRLVVHTQGLKQRKFLLGDWYWNPRLSLSCSPAAAQARQRAFRAHVHRHSRKAFGLNWIMGELQCLGRGLHSLNAVSL